MKYIYIISLCFIISACASSTPIILSCNEQHIEIYADGYYLGRGYVNYVVPKGQNSVEISCRENGIEIYSRKFNVKGMKNYLFELNIPKDYKYSSNN